MDAVSAVLVTRARVDEGLASMVGASAVVHLALMAVVALVPAAFWGVAQTEPEVVMQVSLGGPIGPRDGGLATLGGRPIQQVRPVEAKPAVEAVRPPAARTPEMVEPTKAPPRKTTPNKADAKDPRSRTPTMGEEVRAGSTVADTGGKGQGFGLSAGGGGTGGYLDIANFCCPEYLATMTDLIYRNWSSKQGAAGTTQLRFLIERDGRIAGVLVERSSGVQALDYMASRALQLTRLPPLPAAYTEPALTVHLIFEYSR